MSNWRPEGWYNPYSFDCTFERIFEKGANALLGAITEKIEKVEKKAENTPRYWDGLGNAYRDGWENACQEILAILKEDLCQ